MTDGLSATKLRRKRNEILRRMLRLDTLIIGQAVYAKRGHWGLTYYRRPTSMSMWPHSHEWLPHFRYGVYVCHFNWHRLTVRHFNARFFSDR